MKETRILYRKPTAESSPLSGSFGREQAALAREKKLQETTLAIKKKFGKNAILKGMSLEEGATARERNAQIGGHKA